ncbi:MAG: hypothetical protein HGA95_05260, partial [Caldiserica bacterium]|nr:hypothetical protein [Caldisericota bacterium]
MKKNIVFGIILSLVIVAVIVTLVVFFVGRGNSLANAVEGGSCNGCTGGESSCTLEKSAGCSQSSIGCSEQASSCTGVANPKFDPKVDYSSIERQAVEFYSSKTGDNAVSAKAFGIDKINVVITKDDKIVERYTYENGNFVK